MKRFPEAALRAGIAAAVFWSLPLLCVRESMASDEGKSEEAAEASSGPRAVFIVAEREYETERTLKKFFDGELAPRGWTAAWIHAPDEGSRRYDFDGLPAALESANLVFLSVRRRAPRKDELGALREWLRTGKPLVAIRTSSHAFDTRGDVPDGHDAWPSFDREVLGGTYTGHYGDGEVTVSIAEDAASHPILAGVSIEKTAKLYRSSPLLEDTTALLIGRVPGKPPEPLAWTHVYGPRKARVFYTSMGVPEDFENAGFRRLLLQASYWAIDRERTRAKNPDGTETEPEEKSEAPK